jgi:hypothetical protein
MLHELTAHVKRAAEDDSIKALLLSAVRRVDRSIDGWMDEIDKSCPTLIMMMIGAMHTHISTIALSLVSEPINYHGSLHMRLISQPDNKTRADGGRAGLLRRG